MKNLTKTTVYVPVNDDEEITAVCTYENAWVPQQTVQPVERFVLTEEQLNELLSSVIKETLNIAAENAEVRITENALIEDGSCYTTYDDGVISATSDRQSILNQFDNMFNKIKV